MAGSSSVWASYPLSPLANASRTRVCADRPSMLLQGMPSSEGGCLVEEKDGLQVVLRLSEYGQHSCENLTDGGMILMRLLFLFITLWSHTNKLQSSVFHRLI